MTFITCLLYVRSLDILYCAIYLIAALDSVIGVPDS